MRVVVLGAGGLGSAVGALLARAGHDVTLIYRSPTSARHVRDAGISVEGVLTFDVRPQTATNLRPGEAVDLLIVAVKAQDTAAALERVAGVAARTAISVQNGLDKEAPLVERFGAEHVIGAIVQVTAVALTPALIRCVAIAPSFVGELDGTESRHASRLARELARAGMPTKPVADIEAIEWTKAVQWIPGSLLSALTRLDLCDIYEHVSLAPAAVELMRECAVVAAAAGFPVLSLDGFFARDIVTLTNAEAIERLHEVGSQMRSHGFAGYRASMLLDVERGRETEIEQTVGALERIAAGLDIPVPRLALGAAVVRALGPHQADAPARAA